MSASLQNKQTDGLDNKDIDLTYYVTADYNYLERYYLSAALAMDGSSKFGVDAEEGVKMGNYAFGFFPSVEAAWVICVSTEMKRSVCNASFNFSAPGK